MATEHQSWLTVTIKTYDDDVREHAGAEGYLPLVFDVAGSRVARTDVQIARMVKSLNILDNRSRWQVSYSSRETLGDRAVEVLYERPRVFSISEMTLFRRKCL
jgi:hypothetical protein